MLVVGRQRPEVFSVELFDTAPPSAKQKHQGIERIERIQLTMQKIICQHHVQARVLKLNQLWDRKTQRHATLDILSAKFDRYSPNAY